MDLNVKIGGLLKTKREAKKLSLSQVGELIGKHKTTVHFYETGRIPVDVSLLDRLCRIYGTDMYEFLDEIRKDTR